MSGLEIFDSPSRTLHPAQHDIGVSAVKNKICLKVPTCLLDWNWNQNETTFFVPAGASHSKMQ